MIKLGITGGIGSGKSVVAKALVSIDIPVYNADDEAKRITATSPVVMDALTARFGAQLYTDGILDKQLFASCIFSNKSHLATANSIIHPEVLKDFLTWAEQQQKTIVAIESAILFESGFDSTVDRILTVTAPVEIRIERLIRRTGLKRDNIEARIANQWPDERKIEKSDYVIYNDELQPILPQLESIVSQLWRIES
ncbi:MAG: dephospho-CoA kinase [Dysgonamonadaceae bacterium]|jgi:dephospho-CoA kinase|nr:dephospho-CoA kinase [Dysgonamonadaceae bacterium]